MEESVLELEGFAGEVLGGEDAGDGGFRGFDAGGGEGDVSVLRNC